MKTRPTVGVMTQTASPISVTRIPEKTRKVSLVKELSLSKMFSLCNVLLQVKCVLGKGFPKKTQQRSNSATKVITVLQVQVKSIVRVF